MFRKRIRSLSPVRVLAESVYPSLSVYDKPPTFSERAADKIAAIAGSWSFILGFTICLAAWIIVQHCLVKAFDPYPYILLNLFLSTIAAIQAPIILQSQNRHAAKDRLKSDMDLEVDIRSGAEIGQIHTKVDHILAILDKLELQLENTLKEDV
jgi:uncharacterized membrane protein